MAQTADLRNFHLIIFFDVVERISIVFYTKLTIFSRFSAVTRLYYCARMPYSVLLWQIAGQL